MNGLSVTTGDVIAGKYRVEGVLGRGAMGMVVSATHLGLGNRVAVKLLHREMLRSEEAVTRFAREARAAAALASDHVTRVLDAGTTESGMPYIVMEHLTGATLDVVVAKEPLSIADAVTFAGHVCDALAEAHAVGITHRDLKPQNIFIVRKPNGQRIAKVLDFGISKIENVAIAGDSREITLTGALVGTPSFMAPEQLRMDGPVGPMTDVWALGATFYFALTKHLPYQTDTFYELNIKMEQSDPTPITAWRSDLPPALLDVFDGCLRRDAGLRFSVATIAARLEDARVELTKASQSDLAVPVATDAVTTASSRKRLALLGAGGAVALAMSLGVWAAARRHEVEIPPVSAETAPTFMPPALDPDAAALVVAPIATTEAIASAAETTASLDEPKDAGHTFAPAPSPRPPRPAPPRPAPKSDTKRGALTHER